MIAGGVHLSTHGPSLQFLVSCGVSVGVGEVETVWDRLVEDALEGALEPIYKMGPDEGLRVRSGVDDIAVPELERLPYPHVPARAMKRYLNNRHLFIDTSRGCPFVCSFCVVKNAFGRSMRSREPARLLEWMADKHDREGVSHFWLHRRRLPAQPAAPRGARGPGGDARRRATLPPQRDARRGVELPRT